MKITPILFLCFAWPITVFSASYDPEQVHIAPGDQPESITVSWATRSKCKKTLVTFQKAEDLYDEERNDKCEANYGNQTSKSSKFRFTIAGDSNYFSYRSNRFYVHTVIMKRLQPSTFYIYKVGNEFGWSRTFKFRSLPNAVNGGAFRVCIFGDLSLKNGVSIPHLRLAAKSHKIDLIIHVGDIAYDFHRKQRGNDYLNALEEIFAQVPYVIVPGNHEEDGREFHNIRHRFRMPNSPDASNQFHTFVVGPVRFVGVNSELYYKHNNGRHRLKRAQTQLKWLHNTMKTALNGGKTPWLIAYQHRPFLCSSDDFRRCPEDGNPRLSKGLRGVGGLEELFSYYGVDLTFSGHEHFYERFNPLLKIRPLRRKSSATPAVYKQYESVLRARSKRSLAKYSALPDRRVMLTGFSRNGSQLHNAMAPVHIVTGAAGCKEPLTRFRKDSPAIGSAKRVRKYGFTILTVQEDASLRIEQISVQDKGRVIDELTLTKDFY